MTSAWHLFREGLRDCGRRLSEEGEPDATIPALPLKDDLRAALANFPDVRLAVLFGSVAHGKQTLRSALDLAVLLDPYDVKRLWPIDLAAGAVAKRTVDLIDLHTAPPLLRFEIARDGISFTNATSGPGSISRPRR